MRACFFEWVGFGRGWRTEGWLRTDYSPGDSVDGWFNSELGRCDTFVVDPKLFKYSVVHRSLTCCAGAGLGKRVPNSGE
jgi:hypothetical protein